MFNKHFRTPKHHVLLSDSVRRPIRFRTPPNQIPFAVQSDSVRRPMKLATVINNISYTTTQHQQHSYTASTVVNPVSNRYAIA